MTTWEITEFQEYLKDKEKYIFANTRLSGDSQMIVKLVFEILQAELNNDFEKSSRELYLEVNR